MISSNAEEYHIFGQDHPYATMLTRINVQTGLDFVKLASWLKF
jgi:hypothetical protein